MVIVNCSVAASREEGGGACDWRMGRLNLCFAVVCARVCCSVLLSSLYDIYIFYPSLSLSYFPLFTLSFRLPFARVIALVCFIVHLLYIRFLTSPFFACIRYFAKTLS